MSKRNRPKKPAAKPSESAEGLPAGQPASAPAAETSAAGGAATTAAKSGAGAKKSPKPAAVQAGQAEQPASEPAAKPRGAEASSPDPILAPTVAPLPAGKPIRISSLKVPPLPRLDTSGAGATVRPGSAAKPAGARARKPNVPPPAQVSAPPAAAPAKPEASQPVEPAPHALVEPPAAATVAPPGKRTRASEPSNGHANGHAYTSVEERFGPGGVAAAVLAPSGLDAPDVTDEAADESSWGADAQGSAAKATSLPTLPSQSALEAESEVEPAARLARGSTADRVREAAAFGTSQSLLSTDYYFRQYGAHGLRSMAAEVDDFGFDPHVDAKFRPVLETLCKRYFRVELAGAEHVPAQGRALLVANRSGALPWDGLVLRTALRSARPGLSPLRWLAEDSVIHYPFMGVFMNRLGAVRACPENAERLLAQERLVAVFPEGHQGSRKLFRDRYRLQRFGRGGYVKLALKFGVPILPTAIIGAEETNPVLGRSRLLGRFFGSDSVPLTPTFPWLGLAGLLPAPVRWRIVVGEPIDLTSYGPESADDALVVHRLNEQIRSSLQALVDQSKQQRGSALFG